MLVELGQPNPAAPPPYPAYFERPFLEATSAYYAAESASAVAELAAPDYLRYAEGRLLYEQEAVRPLLDEGTSGQLRGLLQRELLANHAVALIEVRTGAARE
jgi:cullin 1